MGFPALCPGVPFQHKWPLGICLDVLGKERNVLIFMTIVTSELLEWYRFNRNKIYITDLLLKDLCPLTGMSQSIDAVTKVLLTLQYLVHYRLEFSFEKTFQQCYTLYIAICKSSVGIPCIIKIEWDFPSLVFVLA